MAETRHGIIKKNDVQASGARSAAEQLLGKALRIPKDHVKLDAQEDDATSRLIRSSLRVPRELATPSGRSYEVRTVAAERIEAPREKNVEEVVEEEPEPTPEEIEAMWQARIDEARNQAFAEGRDAGHAEAKAEFDNEVDTLRTQFAEDLDAVQESWKEFIHRSEPQLVQLAFRLARTVLDAPLPDEVRQVSERVVADAVERMATDVAVEIILHPVSFLRIQEAGVEEQLNAIHSKLRWRTNADLKQNEWIVQSPRAATRRIEAELIDQLQRELAVKRFEEDSSS